MADAYSGPETMLFDEPPVQQEQQQEQQQAPQIKIPDDVKPILLEYDKIVPNVPDTVWGFVKAYLTYIEKKESLIKPLIAPDTKNNIIKSLNDVSSSDTQTPWGVYKCFLTISDIGSSIAQKQQLDDRDRYYLMYVMLAFGDTSPIYEFTQLLQKMQSDPNTLDNYNSVNSRFLEAYKRYEPKSSKLSFLDKSCKLGGKDISYKLLLVIAILTLLVIAAAGLYYSSGNKLPFSVGPRVTIASRHSVVSSRSSVSSIMS